MGAVIKGVFLLLNVLMITAFSPSLHNTQNIQIERDRFKSLHVVKKDKVIDKGETSDLKIERRGRVVDADETNGGAITKKEQRRIEEARRRQEEQQRRKAEEERRRNEEARRRQEEQQRRKAEEDRRRNEEARRRQEEQQRRKAVEERRRNEEARRRQEEQQRRKAEEERRKIEEARRRKQEEQKQKEEAERHRLWRVKQKEEAEKRRKEEERRRKQEEERRRKLKEAEEKLRKEEEAKQKERIQKQKEEEEARRKAVEERQRQEREQHEKESWIKYFISIEKQNGDDNSEFWQMIIDDKKNHYPYELLRKLALNLTITQGEEDKFENEYGRFKERNDTNVIDIIASVNHANDISDLEEGDIRVNAPNFDHQAYARSVIAGGEDYQKRTLVDSWKRRKRDSRREQVYLWLDRTVPYEIDHPLRDSEDVIVHALMKIQAQSCIKFVKKDRPVRNWIKFVKKSGCWSSVGRTFWRSGSQEISLGNNCVYPGIIIHEVLHALGFWHEQSRPDRDQYVEIFWENIREGEQHNFQRYDQVSANTLNSPYDFGSIMHYGRYSFAKDAEKPTIISITNPNLGGYGQRLHLSKTDIFQLNALYDCKNTANIGWSNWSDFGPCDNKCVKKRSRYCKNAHDRQSCPNPVSDEMLYWGVDIASKQCSHDECNIAVDGHWNKWGTWSECSSSCGAGMQSRKRLCNDPKPKRGGKKCPGQKIMTRKCQRRSCSSGPFDCSFDFNEQPTCDWQQDSLDDFDWTRNSGTTPSSGTGPNNDHSSAVGSYLYIESSSPARKGFKARLISPVMEDGIKCMSFAFNMNGMSIGSLNIYMKMTSSSAENLLFTKSGDQSKLWHEERFDIRANAAYQIIMEGVVGNDFRGDIAIDHIVIANGECLKGPTPTPTVIPNLPTVSPVGCYHSKGYINGKRLFPRYKNFRRKLDWKNLKNSTDEITKMCAAFAYKKNFEYFGIEFWGECWTGPNDQISYARDGEAEDCWPKKSEGIGPYVVGKNYTVMVYKWV